MMMMMMMMMIIIMIMIMMMMIYDNINNSEVRSDIVMLFLAVSFSKKLECRIMEHDVFFPPSSMCHETTVCCFLSCIMCLSTIIMCFLCLQFFRVFFNVLRSYKS